MYNRLNILMDRFVFREVYPQLLEICLWKEHGFCYKRKVTSEEDAAVRQGLSNTSQ